MASETETNPAPFTFVLEYMGSAMVIKTVRPASYSIIRLCNIASLVLQQKDSPVIHNFHPKAVLPWAGRVINMNTDEMLTKIIQVCMNKGQNELHVAVMFDEQPPYGSTDRHVLTRVLASPDPNNIVIEQTVVHVERMAAEDPPQPEAKVMRAKRKYRCTVCKAEGHGKRTCKIVKPTVMVGSLNTKIWGGKNESWIAAGDLQPTESPMAGTSHKQDDICE